MNKIISQIKESMLGKMFSVASAYWYYLIFIVIFSITAVSVELLIGDNIKQMVSYSTNGNSDQMTSIVFISLISVIIGMISHFSMRWFSTKFSACVIMILRDSFVERLEKAPLSSIEKFSKGDLLSRFSSDLVMLQRFLSDDFPKLFIESLMFLAAFTYLLLINWKLILFSLSLIPFSLLLSFWISKPLNAYALELQQQTGKSASIMKETIDGIQIIKTFRLYQHFFQKFKASIDQILNKSIQIEFRHAMLDPLQILFMSSPLVFSVLYGAYLIAHHELSADGLIAFVYFLGHIIQPVSVIPEIVKSFREAIGGFTRTWEIQSLPEEQVEEKSILPKPRPSPKIEKTLCLQLTQISFTYDRQNQSTLTNVNVELRTGRHIAIVGSSGSGKSTLAKILCGLYSPDSGNARLDPTLQGKWDLAMLRSLITYVPQDVFLFSKSIADNIVVGREEATLEEIVQAATFANAHDFIMNLPEGYETVVGNGGYQLSGGQKQRIGIARAFLKNSPFIIMDEPTSALDNQSENLFQEGLKRIIENKTVVLIAHRLSTIRLCDEIWVMNQGKIVERGTHEELRERDGLYRKLYEAHTLHDLSSQINNLREDRGVLHGVSNS